MLVKKQLLNTLFRSAALIAVLSAQPLPALADNNVELVNAIIQLERDLLSAQEQIAQLKQNGVVIYLDTQGLTSPKINGIDLFIDEQPVNRQTLTATELKTFAAGGIKKLYSAPLSAGPHELRVEVKETADKERPLTKTLRFNQGTGLDAIKITVGSLFKTSKQKISLKHQPGTAK